MVEVAVGVAVVSGVVVTVTIVVAIRVAPGLQFRFQSQSCSRSHGEVGPPSAAASACPVWSTQEPDLWVTVTLSFETWLELGWLRVKVRERIHLSRARFTVLSQVGSGLHSGSRVRARAVGQ